MVAAGAAAPTLLLLLLGVAGAASPEQHRFSPSNASASASTAPAASAPSAPPTLVVDEAAAAGRFEYVSVSTRGPPGSPRGADAEPAVRAGLQFLGHIYDPHRWLSPALAAPEEPHGGYGGPLAQAGPACRAQLRSYLGALDNGTTWAVQMTDASGRYSSQFFFGNDFWLGSHTLCEELGSRYALANPPWPVTFHVVQIKVHLDPVLTPHPRVLHLGVCLPKTCDPKDISALLLAASRQARAPKAAPKGPTKSPSMEVVRIRRVPGPYLLMADTKLHILAGVAAAVVLLMLAGAVLEEVTKRHERRDAQPAHADSERQRVGLGGLGGPAANGQREAQEMQERPPGKANGAVLGAAAKPPQPHKPGVMVQIVMAFSPLSNGAKILSCELQEEDSLTAVHGLRFLSLAWVIMVHTYLQVFAIAENKTLRTVTERNFLFQTVSNATFSVDTFFFISGLLVAFLFFKTTSKKEGSKAPGGVSTTSKVAPHAGPRSDAKKDRDGLRHALSQFLILVGYRFIRLTPAYLFVLGMVEVSMRWIHNNSVFEPKILDHLNCDQYWWRNALYINSLFPRKDMCMLWSWYMSNDTQFYVIGVLLLLFSSRYFRLVAGALVTLLVSSWVTTAFVSVQYEYRARIEEPFDKFDELYDKPWTRLGPYLVGMITGWLLFKTKNRIRMSVPAVILGWTLSLLCLASLVYGLLHQKLGIATSAAYVSLGHTAWGVALGWIVVACYTGHGGYINRLLSFRALQPLSRLTYCAYLLHPMIQVLTSYQMDGPLHLHNSLVLTLYFGNVVASYLLSFVISLAFEAPVVRLLKIAIPPRRHSD